MCTDLEDARVAFLPVSCWKYWSSNMYMYSVAISSQTNQSSLKASLSMLSRKLAISIPRKPKEARVRHSITLRRRGVGSRCGLDTRRCLSRSLRAGISIRSNCGLVFAQLLVRIAHSHVTICVCRLCCRCGIGRCAILLQVRLPWWAPASHPRHA
jgi:hypothetical protein